MYLYHLQSMFSRIWIIDPWPLSCKWTSPARATSYIHRASTNFEKKTARVTSKKFRRVTSVKLYDILFISQSFHFYYFTILYRNLLLLNRFSLILFGYTIRDVRFDGLKYKFIESGCYYIHWYTKTIIFHIEGAFYILKLHK